MANGSEENETISKSDLHIHTSIGMSNDKNQNIDLRRGGKRLETTTTTANAQWKKLHI